MIEKVLKQKLAQKIFSFIIGFGLIVIMFHRPIPQEKRLGLKPAEVEGKEVHSQGKCYKYRVEDCSC